MNLIVDASVVMKWFVDEPLHENARRLLKTGESLHAPDLLVAEVGNIAWKKANRGEIGWEQARKIARSLRDSPISLQASGELLDRALQLALSIKHPVYDCLYLACTEHLEGTFVTADEKLTRILARSLPSINYKILDDGYYISLSESQIDGLIHLCKYVKDTWKDIDKGEVKLHLDTLAFRHIKNAIQVLSEAQKIDLIALGELGQRHSGGNWLQLQENVRKSLSLSSDNDLISFVYLSENIKAGWHKFQKMTDEKVK
jgi:predicted nucleic acid-binding protein